MRLYWASWDRTLTLSWGERGPRQQCSLPSGSPEGLLNVPEGLTRCSLASFRYSSQTSCHRYLGQKTSTLLCLQLIAIEGEHFYKFLNWIYFVFSKISGLNFIFWVFQCFSCVFEMRINLYKGNNDVIYLLQNILTSWFFTFWFFSTHMIYTFLMSHVDSRLTESLLFS